jgi:hypothetical protein
MVGRPLRLFAPVLALTAMFGEMPRGICNMGGKAARRHACCPTNDAQLQPTCCHTRPIELGLGRIVVPAAAPAIVASASLSAPPLVPLRSTNVGEHRPEPPPLIVLRI